MILRDKWGVEVFRSNIYSEIIVFAKKYKEENGLTFVQVVTIEGGHHSFI